LTQTKKQKNSSHFTPRELAALFSRNLFETAEHCCSRDVVVVVVDAPELVRDGVVAVRERRSWQRREPY
jgi:hypothetical protein